MKQAKIKLLLKVSAAMLLSSCVHNEDAPTAMSSPATGHIQGNGTAVSSAAISHSGAATSGKVRDSSNKHLNKLSSANVPGTNHGRLACAWAVNRVTKDGIGREVGGGLSTINMYEALENGRGRSVPPETAPEGSIIISPTSGPRTGHVGILMRGTGDSRRIHSNSSDRALYVENFTLGEWREYYGGRGLKVRAYEVNP